MFHLHRLFALLKSNFTWRMPLLYKFVNNLTATGVSILFLKLRPSSNLKRKIILDQLHMIEALIIQFKYNNKYNRLIIQDTHINFFFLFLFSFQTSANLYVFAIYRYTGSWYIFRCIYKLCAYRKQMSKGTKIIDRFFREYENHYRSVPRQQLYCIVGERTGWHFKCSLLLMFAAMFVTMRARVCACICRGMRSLRDVNRQEYRMCASSCQQDERSLD